MVITYIDKYTSNILIEANDETYPLSFRNSNFKREEHIDKHNGILSITWKRNDHLHYIINIDAAIRLEKRYFIEKRNKLIEEILN